MLGLFLTLGCIALIGLFSTLVGWRKDRVSPLKREFWT